MILAIIEKNHFWDSYDPELFVRCLKDESRRHRIGNIWSDLSSKFEDSLSAWRSGKR